MPPAPIQELRDLTRTRKQLVREMSQHTLRIQMAPHQPQGPTPSASAGGRNLLQFMPD